MLCSRGTMHAKLRHYRSLCASWCVLHASHNAVCCGVRSGMSCNDVPHVLQNTNAACRPACYTARCVQVFARLKGVPRCHGKRRWLWHLSIDGAMGPIAWNVDTESVRMLTAASRNNGSRALFHVRENDLDFKERRLSIVHLVVPAPNETACACVVSGTPGCCLNLVNVSHSLRTQRAAEVCTSKLCRSPWPETTRLGCLMVTLGAPRQCGLFDPVDDRQSAQPCPRFWRLHVESLHACGRPHGPVLLHGVGFVSGSIVHSALFQHQLPSAQPSSAKQVRPEIS